MLNINEKMDCMEEGEKRDNFEQESQSQLEVYNQDYRVNYFGSGRDIEDMQ